MDDAQAESEYIPDPQEHDADLETVATIDGSRMYRNTARRRAILAMKQEVLGDFLTGYPSSGESWHIISDGRFDYWNMAPALCGMLGKVAEFYGSTWTMNRANVLSLFDLLDSKAIVKAAILTGTYFKRRESAVCNTLISGLLECGQRFKAFQNHTKLMLFSAAPNFLTVEGSANFTANPRLEQNTITNDQGLFEFHKAWMNEILEL